MPTSSTAPGAERISSASTLPLPTARLLNAYASLLPGQRSSDECSSTPFWHGHWLAIFDKVNAGGVISKHSYWTAAWLDTNRHGARNRGAHDFIIDVCVSPALQIDVSRAPRGKRETAFPPFESGREVARQFIAVFLSCGDDSRSTRRRGRHHQTARCSARPIGCSALPRAMKSPVISSRPDAASSGAARSSTGPRGNGRSRSRYRRHVIPVERLRLASTTMQRGRGPRQRASRKRRSPHALEPRPDRQRRRAAVSQHATSCFARRIALRVPCAMLLAVPSGRIASGMGRPASRRAAAATVPSPPAATTSSVRWSTNSPNRGFPVEHSHELMAGSLDELANPGKRCAVPCFLVVEE